jgi:hypothetical protein
MHLTPQQFRERFEMLQQVTEARDAKQQAALVRRLRVFPKALRLLPNKVQAKAAALKQQLQRQLGVDPKQTQQLISKHPTVLEYRANSLVQKATEQGKLLDLEAADVLQLWTREQNLPRASTETMHVKLARLQLLLQPYMSQADVRQLVLCQPVILVRSPDAVRVRLEALQECLTDWSPQQLGAALLTYPSVLTRSPETIRHKWRIASQYRDMYMLGTRQQQEQQQQEQPRPATELSLFQWTTERFALLEYMMLQQQQQQQQSNAIVNSTGSSVSNSRRRRHGLISSSDNGAHSSHVPPMLIVLQGRKHTIDRLLQEHYPDFRQWYKQRQQAAKKQGQQPE